MSIKEELQGKEGDSIASDITSLQSQLKEALEANALLRNVINTLPGSIYWKDRDGVYLMVNYFAADRMHSIHHYNQTIVGKTDFDMFTPEEATTYRQHDLEVMTTGKEINTEESVTLPNGEQITQLSSKRPLYDHKGDVVGIVGNTVDITYLKQIEQELRDAKEQAETANIVKLSFMRDMEHDIRTPFSGIWGLSEQLYNEEQDYRKKQLLSYIVDSARELLGYCNAILDFSRIEAGLPVIEKKFNLHALLRSVIDIQSPIVVVKGLDLQLEISENVPEVVLGDDFRLQRILINLISNAIKFTDQGFVRLRVTVTFVSLTDFVIHFHVEDSGIGIAKSHQTMIFESFSRVTPSSTGRYVGTGLGLKAVKHFTEELGGKIQVESELNKGATFICSLPFKISIDIEEPAIEQLPQVKLNLKKLQRVLLVEDSPIALLACVEILTKYGLIVDTAVTAKEAITKAFAENYQLIILDLGLPDLPGIEVARRIRHSLEAKTPHDIPIFVLTAHADESYQTECQSEGIDVYLTKPLTLEKLRAYLEDDGVQSV